MPGSLFQHFDDAGVLGVDGDAVGFEVVEIGASGVAVCCGVPPVVVGGDVAAVVHLVAVARSEEHTSELQSRE